MRNRILYIGLLIATILCSLTAQAEIIQLKSGKTVRGTIVFRNDEVVVFKDLSGSRFQYLMSDIESISSDDEQDEEVILEEVEVAVYKPKVALTFQLSGGGSSLACKQGDIISTVGGKSIGGSFAGDFYVGVQGIQALPNVLLGGGLGYHATMMGGQTISFLPIQFHTEAILMRNPGKHAPAAGMSLGYGVALNKSMKGGLYAGLDFGWHYQFAPKSALFLGLFTNFQNATLTVTETISDASYSSKVSRNLCGYGLKAAIYF